MLQENRKYTWTPHGLGYKLCSVHYYNVSRERPINIAVRMRRFVAVAFLAVLLQASLVASQQPGWWSAVGSQKNGCKVVQGRLADAGAWASFANTMNTTGWAKLNVITNPTGFSDSDQAYLAGCVEGSYINRTTCCALLFSLILGIPRAGYVTQQMIWDSWPSFLYANYHSNMQVPQPVADWFNENDQWVMQQIKANPTSPYWVHVGLLMTQLAGVVDGYTLAAPASQKLTRLDILLMNADGDLSDINDLFVDQTMSETAATARRLARRAGGQDYGSHCSVLIKVRFLTMLKLVFVFNSIE